ncbi:hypothetical protein Trydic_g514 [Trypoxylus dichotomus]
MSSGRDRRLLASVPNIDAVLFKLYVRKEDTCVREWPQRWGWILDVYKKMQEDLGKSTEKSIMLEKPAVEDTRKVAPLPNTSNHEYGWIAAKPEFRLEIYGPDVKSYRIPDIYRSQ